jgi:hypothetical protein
LATKISPSYLIINSNTGTEILALSPDLTENDEVDDDGPLAYVLVFNANDPSGAGGITADQSAIISLGLHMLSR